MNTPTNSPTATGTSTYTNTATKSPTSTFTHTATNSPTNTATSTPTRTATNSPTPTFSNTATNSATNTFTSTPTNTFTPTPNANIGKTVSESVAKAGDTITYTLTLSVPTGPVNNVQVTDVIPAYLSFVGFVSVPSGGMTAFNPATKTLTVTFPSLAAGTYTLTYQAQVTSFVPQGVVITNNAQLTYSGLATPKTASVNVTMATGFEVHIAVYNEAGELIKEVWTQQLSQAILSFNIATQPSITSLHGQVYVVWNGQQIATWDGTNSIGDPVTNGNYYVKVDNVDNLGVVTSVTQTVTVSRSIAKVAVNVYNEAGEIVRHLYAYADDPNNNPLTDVQFSKSLIAPSNTGVANAALTITSSNGLTLVWDGRSDSGAIVTNGQYLVEVSYKDGKGGQEVITRQVAVESVPQPITKGNVFAGPNVLKVGETSTLVQVHADIQYTLTARLYDTAGELVKPESTGLPGTNQVLVDVRGLASSLYFVVVELTNPQGGFAGRQVTQIVIRH